MKLDISPDVHYIALQPIRSRGLWGKLKCFYVLNIFNYLVSKGLVLILEISKNIWENSKAIFENYTSLDFVVPYIINDACNSWAFKYLVSSGRCDLGKSRRYAFAGRGVSLGAEVSKP